MNRKAIAQCRYQHGKKGQFVCAIIVNRKTRNTEQENDCQLAVNSALEINKELKRRKEAGLIPETVIRIGINAGEVVTGNVGTSERKQYSVTGQPVIIAARLEQINKELNSVILISDSVYKRISLSEEPKYHQDVVIKGITESITVYQLV